MSEPSSPRNIAAALLEFGFELPGVPHHPGGITHAKVHGSLGWRTHAGEDELFLVLKGHLRIELDGGVIELDEGQIHVVPGGTRHRPSAISDCEVLLVERASNSPAFPTVSPESEALPDGWRPS